MSFSSCDKKFQLILEGYARYLTCQFTQDIPIPHPSLLIFIGEDSTQSPPPKKMLDRVRPCSTVFDRLNTVEHCCGGDLSETFWIEDTKNQTPPPLTLIYLEDFSTPYRNTDVSTCNNMTEKIKQNSFWDIQHWNIKQSNWPRAFGAIN